MTGNLADVVISYITSGKWMARRSDRGRPTHDEVATLANHLYEARGRQDGYDLDDWLLAEQELKHYYEWGHRSEMRPGRRLESLFREGCSFYGEPTRRQ
jgi:hypothetical protein